MHQNLLNAPVCPEPKINLTRPKTTYQLWGWDRPPKMAASTQFVENPVAHEKIGIVSVTHADLTLLVLRAFTQVVFSSEKPSWACMLSTLKKLFLVTLSCQWTLPNFLVPYHKYVIVKERKKLVNSS